jgi:hypothetical protein
MSLKTFLLKYLGWCPMNPDQSPPNRTDSTVNMFEDFLTGWRNYLLTVALLSIILASSLILAPPPPIQTTSTPDPWDTVFSETPEYPEPSKRITVNTPDSIISEQTTLEGTERIEIKNKTVWIKDLLLLKDDSELYFMNCTVILPKPPEYLYDDIFHEYVGILLTDSSSLTAINSTFVPSERYNGIGFIGSSQANLTNTILANCSLNFDEHSKLEATNSVIYQIYVDNDTNLVLKDSVVSWLHQKHRWRSRWHNILKISQPEVKVIDSRIGVAHIRIINSSRVVIDGDIGYQKYWNIIDAYQIDGYTMNLTLVESELGEYFGITGVYSVFNVTGGKYLGVMGTNSDIYLSGSEIYGVSIAGNSSATISDSNVYHLGTSEIHSYVGDLWRPMAPGSVHQEVNISESRVEYLNIAGNTDIICDALYVCNVGLGETVSSIWGSVQWGDVNYVKSGSYDRWAFTQHYTVQTIGEEYMVPGVELQVVNSTGDIVWSGVSDEDGCAEFNITFCSYYPLYQPYRYVTNYNGTWNLTGTYGNEVKSVGVSMFETGSPIRLDYSKDVFTLPINNSYLVYACLVAIIVLSIFKFRVYYLNNDLDPFKEDN